MKQLGPYISEDDFIVQVKDYLSEKTATMEDDLDDAMDWVKKAIRKYERNALLFSNVLAQRISTGQRADKTYTFQVAKTSLKNLDTSFKTLHYKIKIRDTENFKAVIYIEFLNDQAHVFVSYDKKRLGDKWVNNTMDAANFIVKLLPDHIDA